MADSHYPSYSNQDEHSPDIIGEHNAQIIRDLNVSLEDLEARCTQTIKKEQALVQEAQGTLDDFFKKNEEFAKKIKKQNVELRDQNKEAKKDRTGGSLTDRLLQTAQSAGHTLARLSLWGNVGLYFWNKSEGKPMVHREMMEQNQLVRDYLNEVETFLFSDKGLRQNVHDLYNSMARMSREHSHLKHDIEQTQVHLEHMREHSEGLYNQLASKYGEPLDRSKMNAEDIQLITEKIETDAKIFELDEKLSQMNNRDRFVNNFLQGRETVLMNIEQNYHQLRDICSEYKLQIDEGHTDITAVANINKAQEMMGVLSSSYAKLRENFNVLNVRTTECLYLMTEHEDNLVPDSLYEPNALAVSVTYLRDAMVNMVENNPQRAQKRLSGMNMGLTRRCDGLEDNDIGYLGPGRDDEER